MTEPKQIPKPLPEITPVTQPFWAAAAKEKLIMQRCRDCRAWIWCPRPACVECGGAQLEWTELGGRGEIFAFTVVREVVGRALGGFAGDIPYVTAWIDLEEGPRILSNVVGAPIEKVTIGAAVEVVFEAAADKIFLPKFKLR